MHNNKLFVNLIFLFELYPAEMFSSIVGNRPGSTALGRVGSSGLIQAYILHNRKNNFF